jgi:hypothetical protein
VRPNFSRVARAISGRKLRVIATVERRLRKSWHLIRQRLGLDTRAPLRLIVEKAPWLHDAQSPVMFGIDDLANAWHDRHGRDRWEPGGDWGGGHWDPGSALRFLESGLLSDFPELKVTFFAVAGPLSAYTRNQPFSYAARLDADEASRRFYRSLADNPRFELAYHGLTHGIAGKHADDFVQEWRAFPSVEEAVHQTRLGLEIFSHAAGIVPCGGKYGGWDYNTFADQAVNECQFLWWCRDWAPLDVAGRISAGYYEPQFFGSNLVIALPSNVHGYFWSRRQVELLLAHQQVISVTEHIAPIRPDGRIQTPNIVNDLAELRRLFRYLRGKKVWYATGSEIASYITARERTIVYDATLDGFSVQYSGRFVRPPITLRLDCLAVCTHARPKIEIVLPDGTRADPQCFRFDLKRYRHLVTVPVMPGRYLVQPYAG